MPQELILDGANAPRVADIPQHRVAQNEAAHQANLLKRPKEEAMAVLLQWDAKGFTRAWESTMAPIEAAGNVSEYDANVLAEKRAARAVVVA